jgi:hypothetical protein
MLKAGYYSGSREKAEQFATKALRHQDAQRKLSCFLVNLRVLKS